MKKYSLLILIVLLLISCSNQKQQGSLPTIDVTKSYPKKEIVLQDIADVEYIPLETRDDVLIDKSKGITAVSDNTIVVFNKMQGDIFFFDKKGKCKYKFNHKGQSGKEYSSILDILVDKGKDELLVIEDVSDKVLVYDMKGNYKRSFVLNKGIEWNSPFYNYNRETLIYAQEPNIDQPFYFTTEDTITQTQLKIISKQTGEIDTLIKIPEVKGVSSRIIIKKGKSYFFNNRKPAERYVKTSEGVLINDVACDTLFVLTANKTLVPFFSRTPKISAKDKPLKMVGINAVSKDAIYITVMDKKYEKGGTNNYPTKTYLWDKKQKQIFEYTLKKESSIVDSWEGVRFLAIEDLLDDLEEGKLSGDLKKIAEKLNDDDNPVVVKVTLK